MANTNDLERELAKVKSDLAVSERERLRLQARDLDAIAEAAKAIQRSHEEVLRRLDATLAKDGGDANG